MFKSEGRAVKSVHVVIRITTNCFFGLTNIQSIRVHAIIDVPNKHVDTHGTAVPIGLLKTGLKLDWLGECFASSAATLMFRVFDVT